MGHCGGAVSLRARPECSIASIDPSPLDDGCPHSPSGSNNGCKRLIFVVVVVVVKIESVASRNEIIDKRPSSLSAGAEKQSCAVSRV
jgi:hypothetical protein